MNKIAKTKILVTLGPASEDIDVLKSLIRAGADAVRLNMSHGNDEFFEKIFSNINQACIDEKTPLAILVDLQGPKIRIGELETSEVILEEGKTIEITIKDIKGNKKIISSSYKSLVNDANIGNNVLINDGLIRLTITEKKN